MAERMSLSRVEAEISKIEAEIERAEAAKLGAWTLVQKALKEVFERVDRAGEEIVQITRRRHPWDRRDQDAVLVWKQTPGKDAVISSVGHRLTVLLRLRNRLRKSLS